MDRFSSTGLWGCCSEHGCDVRHPRAGDPLLGATVDWDERGQKTLGHLLQNVFLLTTFCSATPLTRLEINSKLAVLSIIAFQKCKQKLRQPLGASWDQTTPRTNRRATYPASRPTQYITCIFLYRSRLNEKKVKISVRRRKKQALLLRVSLVPEL